MGKSIAEISSVELYMAKSNPPKYILDVRGKVSTSGWSSPRLEPRMYIGGTPPDGVYGFDFVADPPEGVAMMVVLPVTATFEIDGALPASIKGFRVFSANNDLSVVVECAKVFA